MRIAIPPEINKLAEVQIPYAFFDENEGVIKLRDDAPENVIKARRRYLEWWDSQKVAQ